MDNRASQPAAPSLAALLGGIMYDAKDLLVQELTLAKLEGHDELRHIKTAAIVLGIGVGVTAIGGMFWWAICSAAGVVAARLLLAPHLEKAYTTRGGHASDSPVPQPASRSSAALNGMPSESARPARQRQ